MDYTTSRRCKLSDQPKRAPSIAPVLLDNVLDIELIQPELRRRSCQQKQRIDEMCKTKRWLWNKFSRGMNPWEKIPSLIQEQKISRAYYKMWEILAEFRILDDYTDCSQPISFLHLCEGPGGFIQACREYRQKLYKDEESVHKDTHVGITLKPNEQDTNLPDFSQDVGNITNCKVIYGQDGTGDLYNTKNIKGLPESLAEASPLGNKAQIITADGGFDVSDDFDNQETLSAKLFLCQVLSALECQAKDGHFVMKIFDMHTRVMMDILYMLRINYRLMYIYKPAMSRPCNSEYYVVCLLFKDEVVKSHITKLYTMLNKINKLPPNYVINSLFSKPPPIPFMNEIALFNNDISHTQFANIDLVINTINQGKNTSNAILERHKETQMNIAREYCKIYKLIM